MSDEMDHLRAELAEVRELLDHTAGISIAVRSAISAAVATSFTGAQRRRLATSLRLTAIKMEKNPGRYTAAAVATLVAIADATDEMD